MTQKSQKTTTPVALITGGARRIGACIATILHGAGFNIVIHYRYSKKEANKLKMQLNKLRDHSAEIIQANLDDSACYDPLIKNAYQLWKRLDVLINNASTFKTTLLGNTAITNWDDLCNSNLKAPFFLSQAACVYLKKTRGIIINITDIHAEKPMKNYSVYSIAKAGLAMLTKSLALELAPFIRVNAIAPGSVLWPEGKNQYTENKKMCILSSTLLKKQIHPTQIAQAALFLIKNTAITGQTIAIDGGRL